MSANLPVRLGRLCRSFGPIEALKDIDLDIRHHEFVTVVGPSGCGKTTLLNLLAGYDQPSSGSVTREGRARMIHQRDGLFPWLTVAENIMLGLRCVPSESQRHRQLTELLELIRLAEFAKHYPHQVSGGMRQLVELARALAGDSDVLLMDEPFSSLDYLSRLRMREELARLLREWPRTVVLVTHDIEEAAQLADRIVLLTERPGRIRREFSVEVVRPRSPTHTAVVQTVHHILAEMGAVKTLVENRCHTFCNGLF